jgi:hypothetical protein
MLLALAALITASGFRAGVAPVQFFQSVGH